MNARYLYLPLLLVFGWANAQIGELYNADVTAKTSIDDPAKAVGLAEKHWMAFSIPALAGTVSPCCWKGRWNNRGEAGCSLGNSHNSYGTHDRSPLTDNIIVYSEIQNNIVTSVRVVGESCPVDAEGEKVTWIGDVNETAGMDWLTLIARSDDASLYALSLYGSVEADKRLYSMAKENQRDLSEHAIFWLGEARGETGFQFLKKLLDELPQGQTRRHINMALAQSGTASATDLLFDIAETDADNQQREDALFWLAQQHPVRARELLLEIIATETDEQMLEHAVFAISQFPDDSGSQLLMDLAKSSETPRVVRRQALFWLANSDDDDTIAALTELLTN